MKRFTISPSLLYYFDLPLCHTFHICHAFYWKKYDYYQRHFVTMRWSLVLMVHFITLYTHLTILYPEHPEIQFIPDRAYDDDDDDEKKHIKADFLVCHFVYVVYIYDFFLLYLMILIDAREKKVNTHKSKLFTQFSFLSFWLFYFKCQPNLNGKHTYHLRVCVQTSVYVCFKHTQFDLFFTGKYHHHDKLFLFK